jgi:hypothetical protein
MADLELTQAEADALIAMEKHRADDRKYDFPVAGDKLMIPLLSVDKRENFILDVSRGRIDLSKIKYQNRARQVIVLVRIDLGGAPHRNPDETEIACPHLHLYREGYGDKWALSLPSDKFSQPTDLWKSLQEFMSFCNISQPPLIERGLFT